MTKKGAMRYQKKEQKEYKKELELRKRRNKVIQKLEERKIKLSILVNEQKEKMKRALDRKECLELTKKHGISEPILNRIAELPEVIVNMIYKYIPYSARLNLLEQQTKAMRKYLVCMNTSLLMNYLERLSRSKEFLTILAPEEALKQIKYLEEPRYAMGHWNGIPMNYQLSYGIENPNYNPYFSKNNAYGNGSSNQWASIIKMLLDKIVNLFGMAKQRNPEFAYKILLALHVKIELTKQYKISEHPSAWSPAIQKITDLPIEYRKILHV